MSSDRSRLNRGGGARERHARRAEAKPASRPSLPLRSLLQTIPRPHSSGHFWTAPRAAVAFVLLLFALFVAQHTISGRIFPNVWSFGVAIGDATVNEASERLVDAWNNSVQIQLIDGQRTWNVKPSDLGLTLDSINTAQRARGVGLAGFPLGYGVAPTVTLDRSAADSYLRHLASQVNVAPYNAGYAWQGDQLVGQNGRDGVQLDVPTTLDRLAAQPADIVNGRRLELTVAPVKPDVTDPSPFLADAQLIATRPFEVRAYDPFDDETVTWPASRDALTSWLEAGKDSLTIRPATFTSYLNGQDAALNSDGQAARYLDADESLAVMKAAISGKQTSALLRIRHKPTTFKVEYGDTGYGVSRKSGITFAMLEKANPGRDLSALMPGDVLNVPSPDPMVPLNPVSSKRIVVNLDDQTLAAFEDGKQVFQWSISSGMEEAPTSPGVYQILSHEPVALGSSYTLCNKNHCGEWQMNWFMGVYEAVPGLMNGLHGAVLLPGGKYLGDGHVGQPYTFGCVMSPDGDAKELYDWADEGTIVEIISLEYGPKSPEARTRLGALPST